MEDTVRTGDLCEASVLSLVPSILTPGEYKNRNDRVEQFLHWKICKHYSVETNSNWYEHHPEPVTEGSDLTITILWDLTIHTDRTVQANRPDILIKDRKNNSCLLIDMSVPSDRKVSAKMINNTN